jgi:hypothetical protein
MSVDRAYNNPEEGPDMFKIKHKVILELSRRDLQLIFEGLMNWRNRLIGEGRPVEPIDDMLVRVMDLI